MVINNQKNLFKISRYFVDNKWILSEVIIHNVENGLMSPILKKKFLKYFQLTTIKKLIVYSKTLTQCLF